MLRLLCVSFLLLLSATAAGQDEARALAAFDKAFALPKARADGPSADARKAALAGLAGLDSANVAATLVEGWQNLAEELLAVDAERAERSAEMAAIIVGQEAVEKRTLPQDRLQRFNELKEIVAKLRQRSDELTMLQQEVGTRIAELRRKDGVLLLLKKVCGSKKTPLPLRLAAARAVGGGATDVLEDLAAALDRAKDPAEQVVLLDAMALAGPQARLHATPVVELLASKEDAVAERAALALAKLAVPDGVGPMIGLLARSDGPMKQRVAAALEVLTGEQFGDNVGAWQAWWQSVGPTFASEGRELGRGTPSNRKDTNQFYYFGIPQDQCESILYVIDCSGSMKKEITVTKGFAAGGEGGGVMSRLEACKAELIHALAGLKPRQKFAILWYNDLPHWWEQKMQLATRDTVARAQKFVADLQPASSTNIHDSLEQAFTLVGRGAKDRYYGLELDTIFLLTDGSPTTPDGKPDSTDTILVGVRAWNPLKRVTIHCIGLGKELNEPFLRQLASEHGGEFRQY